MVHIDLRLRICNLGFLFNTSRELVILRGQSVDSSSRVVIKLQCVTVGNARGLSNGDSAAAFPALTIPVLNRHDLVTEVALVHVEVETIHGNQLDKGNVVSLFFLVYYVIAKHETAFLTCMCMEIYEHLETFVLLCLLNYGLATSPNRWLIRF